MADFTETADRETSSDLYAIRFSGNIGKWFLEVQKNCVLKAIGPKKNLNILEVGGGHGQLIPYLLENDHKITVLSSHPDCRRRIKSYVLNNDVNFVVGDLINLPFPNDYFDVAISIRLIAHCNNWQKLIAELSRVSKSQVIIDYPAKESINIFYNLMYNLKKNSEGSTRPFTVFRKYTIQQEFFKNNYKLDQNIPQFFLPMFLYRKIKSRFFAKFSEIFFKICFLTHFLGSPIIASYKKINK